MIAELLKQNLMILNVIAFFFCQKNIFYILAAPPHHNVLLVSLLESTTSTLPNYVIKFNCILDLHFCQYSIQQ